MRRRRVGFGLALALVALTLPASAGAATETFEYTGAAQTWVVPAGVTEATFDVYGAQGGTFAGALPGGRGAYVRAILPVTPGEQYAVYVGGFPGQGANGGFNGGGEGGGAGAGGGASDVRLAGNRMLIAGGGGGSAVNACPQPCASGEDGLGGASGTAGHVGFSVDLDRGGAGGGPGTQLGGGGGGDGGASPVDPGADGGDGVLAVGGLGGGGAWADRAGGGGGGGYYGGGGGGGSGQDGVGCCSGGGGGGGGSSYVAPGVLGSVTEGAREGAGLVRVTYGPEETGQPADTQAPESTIAKHPKKKTTKRKAKFEFSSSEPGSTFQCKLDKKDFVPCASPFTRKVKAGKKHTFEVFSTDAAGNADPTPATYKWNVLTD